MSAQSEQKTRQVHNVLIVGVGFFALFMAFHTAQALQSSLNGTLGSICLSTLYGTFALTCVITPKFVNWLGPKNSMIIGGIPYVLMILSNLHPSYELSIPANFLVGLGAPLLWTGEGVYIQRCALLYASNKNTHGDEAEERAATSYLNGIFFLCYLGDGLAGLVLSSLILTYVGDDAKDLLFIILSVIGCIGIGIFCLIRPVPAITLSMQSEDAGYTQSNKTSVSIFQTLKLAFSDLKMTLMIPICYYAGMSIGFLLGDYTRFMISKSMGTSFNGYVVGTFYGVNAFLAYIFGHAAGSSKLGRKGLVIIATLAHLGFYFFVIFWQVPDNYDMDNDWEEINTPDYTSTPYYLFLGAILFAIGDSVWESQPPAILQNYFRDDTNGNAAMSNVKMWGSLGTTTQFLLGFLLADYLDIKIYILLGIFIVAVVSLGILQVIEPMDAMSSSESYKKLGNGRSSFDAGY